MRKRAHANTPQDSLTDGELVRLLSDTPWEQGLRESGEVLLPNVDARTRASAESDLSSWLCTGLVTRPEAGRPPAPASVSERSASGIFKRMAQDLVPFEGDEATSPIPSRRRIRAA